MKLPRVAGTYSLPSSYQAASGETIKVSQHNPPLEDIAQALTDSLPRDGSAAMVANLPLGGFRITGLGAATQPSDAVRKDQAVYSAYLSSVSGLSLAADEMVYATGTNVAGKATITSFARTLLDDADAATSRTTLGLGGLSTLDILDEDDFASNSATRPPSQQSVGAHLDIVRWLKPVAVGYWTGTSLAAGAVGFTAATEVGSGNSKRVRWSFPSLGHQNYYVSAMVELGNTGPRTHWEYTRSNNSVDIIISASGSSFTTAHRAMLFEVV